MKRTSYAVAAAVTALVVMTLLTTTPCTSQASGKIHIVVKGDTLWDISSFYIYDPFLWPQIWSANREIENPHLIYPGQEVVIPEMVVRMAPPPREAKPPLPAPPPPEPVVAQPVQTEPEPAREPAPEPEPEPEPVLVTEEVKQEMILAMSTYGFIIDDKEIGIGTITSTEENRLLISPGMKVYVESDGEISLWRRYSIVRVYDQISHPVTGKKVGYLAKVLGDMNVVHSKGKLSTAIVKDVYKDIQIGDHIIEHLDYLTWIPKEENDLSGDLTGYILIHTEGKSVMGKGDVVFIDLGIEDGLKTGDTLDLVGKKKTVGGVVTPPEVIGEVKVIVPRPGTSVARITKSTRDIGIGTEVVSGTR